MASNETLIPIPGRLKSVATEGHVAGADQIIDDEIGESQQSINANYNTKLDLIINDIDQSREIILDKLSDIEELDNYFVTTYVIDQTNPIGLADTFIRKNTASKDSTKKITINGEEEYVDVIRRIRDKSDLYVGKFDETTNTLNVKLVSKTDKTLYADGTNVSITANDELDMFMKLPAFYWKCLNVDENIAIVEFSMSNEHIDTSWHYWEGDTFIGVYEGYIINDKLYSKPNVTPTVNKSWNDFTTAARARYNSNYHTLINYDSHKIMALLGYGWFNSTNAQKYVGYGISTYPKVTGLCDSLGMDDGMNQNINFWGIENWWGDISEFVDNLQTANSTGLINILGPDKTTVVRTVQAQCALSVGHCITKMELGSYGDLVPKELVYDDYNRGFADGGGVYAGGGYVAVRSAGATYVYGGLGYLDVSAGAGATYGHIGSRLQYKGAYNIVNSL